MYVKTIIMIMKGREQETKIIDKYKINIKRLKLLSHIGFWKIKNIVRFSFSRINVFYKKLKMIQSHIIFTKYYSSPCSSFKFLTTLCKKYSTLEYTFL